jgi:hypothetical protein
MEMDTSKKREPTAKICVVLWLALTVIGYGAVTVGNKSVAGVALALGPLMVLGLLPFMPPFEHKNPRMFRISMLCLAAAMVLGIVSAFIRGSHVLPGSRLFMVPAIVLTGVLAVGLITKVRPSAQRPPRNAGEWKGKINYHEDDHVGSDPEVALFQQSTESVQDV